MAGELALTPCSRKNPSSLLQLSLLPLFPVWSILQRDDLLFHNCSIFLFPCVCLHPLCWGLTLEHPKPISSSHSLSSLRLFFLQTLQLLLSLTSQNLTPSRTTHLIDLSSLIDQS